MSQFSAVSQAKSSLDGLHEHLKEWEASGFWFMGLSKGTFLIECSGLGIFVFQEKYLPNKETFSTAVFSSSQISFLEIELGYAPFF